VGLQLDAIGLCIGCQLGCVAAVLEEVIHGA
jgi:hypothetical protein